MILLVKTSTRILVTPTWPPISSALFSTWWLSVLTSLFRRVPHPAVCEVLHHYVFVRASELSQGWEELLLIPRPERGWLVFDEDGPVHEARRHASFYKAARRHGHDLPVQALEFFNQSRALEVEEPRGPALVAVRPIE